MPPAADWPVRGDLAGDAGFVAAVLRRVRTEHADADRVLFAGRLAGGARVAFVARDRDEASAVRALDVYALRIPPGGSVQDGEVTVLGRGLIESTGPLGWARPGTDGNVQVVLVGQPGLLEAQVSARIDNHPDGSATRRWLDVRGQDGSVVVNVGTRTDPVVFARIRGSVEVPVMIEVEGTDASVPAIAGVASARYDGPELGVLAAQVADACRPVLDVGTADIRVIWSGPLGDDVRAALLRIRRSDGPAYQLLVGQGGTGETFVHGPLQVPWSDADVLPWLFEEGDPSRPMVLINPTGAGTASISYPDEPPRVVTLDARGTGPLGVGGPSPPNLYRALVEVRTPAGRVVVKNQLRAVSGEDPWVLDL